MHDIATKCKLFWIIQKIHLGAKEYYNETSLFCTTSTSSLRGVEMKEFNLPDWSTLQKNKQKVALCVYMYQLQVSQDESKIIRMVVCIAGCNTHFNL